MPPVSSPHVHHPDRLEALLRTGLLDAPPQDAFDRLTRLATRMIGAPVALVSLVAADRQFFLSQQGLPEPWASRRGTPLTHSFCQHVVAGDAPLVVGDAHVHPLVHDNRAVDELGVAAYAGVPLRDPDGVPLGAFCVIADEVRDWTPDELGILHDLAAAAMTEVALRRALDEEARRSRTDPLTRLANRRAMLEALDARGGPDAARAGLVLFDIDHFKAVNDVHGHAAGDAVLRSVAAVLRATVGGEGLVARWGGEEFAVLVPDARDEAALVAVAERVRAAVAAAVPADDGGVPLPGVRVSAGCALSDGADPDPLVDRADRALYAAKRRGRDRCVGASRVRASDRDLDAPAALGLAMALARAAGLPDAGAEDRCRSIAETAVRIGRRLGLDGPALSRCRLGGWLDALGRRPGSGDRRDSAAAARLVADVPELGACRDLVLHADAWFDGSGTPDGPAGEEIPPEARIIAVASAHVRASAGGADADAVLRAGRGARFDPAAVDALLGPARR